MGIEKKTMSFRVDEIVIDDLKEIALEQNRSVSNLIETILKAYIKAQKAARVNPDA